MGTDRRKLAVLAVLVVVLGGVLYRSRPPAGQDSPNRGRPAGTAESRVVVQPPDVRLEVLGEGRVERGDAARNLFRFRPRSTVEPTAAIATPMPTLPPDPRPALPQGAGVLPITLKFIGIVEAPDRALRLAILSDGRGVYHGREGDIIEGRYRIVRIGTESIEMSHVDGRGTQTIRLTGS